MMSAARNIGEPSAVTPTMSPLSAGVRRAAIHPRIARSAAAVLPSTTLTWVTATKLPSASVIAAIHSATLTMRGVSSGRLKGRRKSMTASVAVKVVARPQRRTTAESFK